MTEKPTILLIDDLSKTARLVRMYLNNNVEVISTGAGLRGEEIARSRRPDLILLDIGLPDIDGLDLLTRFRNDPDLAGIPVIMLTGLDDQARKQRAFSLGAYDYIVRPFEAQELRSRIYGVLASTITMRQIEEREHKYRALVENLSAAVFQADRTGTIVFVNPAWEAVTGYPSPDSAGMKIQGMIFGQDEESQRFAEFLANSGAGGTFRSQREIRTRDGNARFVKITVAPFTINDEIFFEGTLEDITQERNSLLEKEGLLARIRESNDRLNQLNTELNATLGILHETQAQLVTAERMKAMGMIVAGVRHEINNPNAALLSAQEEIDAVADEARDFFLSLLRGEDRESPAAEKMLSFFEDIRRLGNIIRQGSGRIREIVSVMRAFMRHQEEGVQTAGIRELLLLARTVFHYQHSRIPVEIFAEPEDLTVSGNIAELNQAFLNLMLDAVLNGAGQMSFRISGISGSDYTLEFGFMSADPQAGTSATGTAAPDAERSGTGLNLAARIFRKNGAELTVYPENRMSLRFSIPLSK